MNSRSSRASSMGVSSSTSPALAESMSGVPSTGVITRVLTKRGWMPLMTRALSRACSRERARLPAPSRIMVESFMPDAEALRPRRIMSAASTPLSSQVSTSSSPDSTPR